MLGCFSEHSDLNVIVNSSDSSDVSDTQRHGAFVNC